MRSFIILLFFIRACLAQKTHLQQECADFSTTITESKCIACDPAKRGQYPWHVGLTFIFEDNILCGGTLITSKLALTAAHCIPVGYYPAELINVILGRIDRSVDEPERILAKGNDEEFPE